VGNSKLVVRIILYDNVYGLFEIPDRDVEKHRLPGAEKLATLYLGGEAMAGWVTVLTGLVSSRPRHDKIEAHGLFAHL